MVEKIEEIAKNAPVLQDLKLEKKFYKGNAKLLKMFYNRATDYDCDSCDCDACHACDCNVCDCYGR